MNQMISPEAHIWANPDEAVLKVESVSRAYYPGMSPAARARAAFGGQPKTSPKWALSGVSFDVNGGEIVGILGANGAGKSTLLKIVAGTLQPTSGRTIVNGSVSAVLELGSGFDGELSAGANARMGLLIRGVDRGLIGEALEWIKDFSELGDQFDYPISTFSSGMQARVAFATALACPSDIIIADEALAVGDAYFVGKCFRLVQSLASSGRTILFTTHSASYVGTLCSRAIVLDRGHLVFDGNTRHAIHRYEELISRDPGSLAGDDASHPGVLRYEASGPSLETIVRNRGFGISAIDIVDGNGDAASDLDWGCEYRVVVDYLASKPGDWAVAFRVQTASGSTVFGSRHVVTIDSAHDSRWQGTVEFGFASPLLGGSYQLDVGAARNEPGGGAVVDMYFDAVQFIANAPDGPGLVAIAVEAIALGPTLVGDPGYDEARSSNGGVPLS